MSATALDLRSRSRVQLDGPDRAPTRAYLKGIGYDDEALARPIVGIANTWTCLLYTSPSPRDRTRSRMPSSA